MYRINQLQPAFLIFDTDYGKNSFYNQNTMNIDWCGQLNQWIIAICQNKWIKVMHNVDRFDMQHSDTVLDATNIKYLNQ